MVDRNFGSSGYSNVNGNPYQEDTQSQIKDKNSLSFTMPGILFWIQEEWNKIEMQRIQWELEKAEYMAEISNLQGERKGQENVKLDLVRRIKMLEYALKEERALTQTLRTTQKLSGDTENCDGANENLVPDVTPPSDPQSLAASGSGQRDQTQRVVKDELANFRSDKDAQKALLSSSVQWKESMQRLKQYLLEVGYTEPLLDVRYLRMKHAMDSSTNDAVHADLMNGEMERRFAGHNRVMASLQDSADAVLNTFDFLDEAYNDKSMDVGEVVDISSAYSADLSKSKPADGAKSISLKEVMDNLQCPDALAHNHRLRGDLHLGELTHINTADECESGIGTSVEQSQRQKMISRDRQHWTLRHTLRAHWDTVRSLSFHSGPHACLMSGGDDGCLLLWNMEPATIEAVASRVWMNEGSSGLGGESGNVDGDGSMGSLDVHPVHSIRAHDGPILSSVIESFQATTCNNSMSCIAFTGGLDGSIHSWSLSHQVWLPQEEMESEDETEDQIDSNPAMEMSDKVSRRIYKASDHGDAVWCLACNSWPVNQATYSLTPLLASGAADGTVKLWSYSLPSATNDNQLSMNCQHTCSLAHDVSTTSSDDAPVGISFLAGGTRMLVATKNGLLILLDVETGQPLYSQSITANQENQRICSMAVHNTLPLAIAGLENGHICFFDSQEGSVIYDCVAHEDTVSSLSFEPHGLYFASTSMDESVRLWDVGSRTCVQHMHAHRSKCDESSLAVTFHSSLPLMATAGADAIVNIYTSL